MSQLQQMIQKAHQVAERAYSPYSNFNVGVCILANGQLYSGCNVENASYSLCTCAEESAIAGMVSSGVIAIDEIVVTSLGDQPCFPCGACRQRILEFSHPKTKIHVCIKDKLHQTYSIEDLIPHSFGKAHLEK